MKPTFPILKRAIPFMVLCLLFAFGSCNPTQVEKPEKTITKEQAAELSTRFVREISGLMEVVGDTASVKMKRYNFSEKADFELTSHVYYSLKELEHYFAWVKQEALAKGHNLEGFRFYFGIYPDDPALGNKQNHMTVFISPAGRNDVQKGGVINFPFLGNDDIPEDIEDIEPYNFGGNGHPPTVKYAN